YPIYGTDNWNTDPSRHEWEGAFPSVVYFNGSWRIMYTATLDVALRQPNDNNYDRINRLDVPSLTSQPANEVRNPFSVQPIDSACQPWGSCPDTTGSGFVEAVTIGGNLYLFHRDGHYQSTHPACDMVRHRVNADMTYTFVGCTTFDSTPYNPRGAV